MLIGPHAHLLGAHLVRGGADEVEQCVQAVADLVDVDVVRVLEHRRIRLEGRDLLLDRHEPLEWGRSLGNRAAHTPFDGSKELGELAQLVEAQLRRLGFGRVTRWG